MVSLSSIYLQKRLSNLGIGVPREGKFCSEVDQNTLLNTRNIADFHMSHSLRLQLLNRG